MPLVIEGRVYGCNTTQEKAEATALHYSSLPQFAGETFTVIKSGPHYYTENRPELFLHETIVAKYLNGQKQELCA